MTINQFPGRRSNKVNKVHERRDGGINKPHERRKEPRVVGSPPSPTCPNPTFERNFGSGLHAKEGVPKSTKHGYSRASHHHDYFSDRNK